MGLSGNSHIAGQDEEEESRHLVSFPPNVFLPLPHTPHLSHRHTPCHHHTESKGQHESVNTAPTLQPLTKQGGRSGHCGITQRPCQQSPRPVGFMLSCRWLHPRNLQSCPPSPPAAPATCPAEGPALFPVPASSQGQILQVWPQSSLCLPIASFLIYSDTLSPRCLFCSEVPEPGPSLHFRRPLSSVSIISWACTKYLFLEKSDHHTRIPLITASKPDLNAPGDKLNLLASHFFVPIFKF